MDVHCEICGRRYDSQDPGVRFVYGDSRWECTDENECFTRRAEQDMPDAVWRNER